MVRGRLGTGLLNNTVRVLAEIILSGKDGITQEELSSRLHIDRTTVYRITDRLEKKEKIRSTSDGRYTIYIANTNAIQDVIVSSHFQAHWAAFQALKSRRTERISRFADKEKLESADAITAAVFLFSIKVGSLITYLLKEALNPKSQFLSAMIESEKDNLTDDQKYELALTWLRNRIIIALPAVLYRFRENIFKAIATNESLQERQQATFDRLLHLMKRRPRHAFSDNVYDLVSEAFMESFQAISRDLDRTARRLPRLVESIYDDGYIEKAQPDTSIDAQTRMRARRMKKNHVHEFTLQVKNNMKHKCCRICGYEQAEPIVSRTEKPDKTH
jgi:DNA-binding MarR family transcriptional regulator/rubrerythrin